ncbi:MAG: AAA family ATPase, partial [Streptosporangiaceae bacterium]
MTFKRKRAEEPATPSAADAEGLRPPDDGPTGASRPTRRRLPLWDRLKYLVLLTLLWLLMVWAAMGDNPLLPFGDACRQQATSTGWVFVLAGIELLRQAHFLVSESWSRYHHFWINRFFGGIERQSHRRFGAWTRFRIARVVRWVFWITVVAFVFGRVQGTGPVQGLYELPAAVWGAMPFLIRMTFYIAFGILQFAAIFWFLSRGGVDVYYPDDIKTRFTDVWGQDHVVERVRENIVFLENPEDIEDRGGYVPGGILLWGPPGTGKTLMAEAVAGETGKPYVFVDPGAFINMFMGVGVLKVKSLFRKVRKLSLRYGGVIVFFDEADSLGRRGIASGGPAGQPGFTGPFSHAGCNGMSYLSGETSKIFMGGGGSGGGGDMGT